MADQEQNTNPGTQLPDQGSNTQPDNGVEKKSDKDSGKHRPDMPEGTFGNPGKAKTKILNK